MSDVKQKSDVSLPLHDVEKIRTVSVDTSDVFGIKMQQNDQKSRQKEVWK